VKAARGQFPAAADRPDGKVRFYLFHGTDEAGSRALANRLLAGLGAEKQGFTGAGLKADPGALAAEAGAISMFGGARLLWIEPAGEDIVPAVEILLSAAVGDHPAVAVAGNLKKGSALQKLAEAHPAALSHQSYVPEGRQADLLVAEMGREEGLRISPPVAAMVASTCSNDRAVIGQELRKFALYLDASPERPAELSEDVIELLGVDAAEGDISRVGDLALSGDVAGLADELERLESSGVDAIPVVRALQRRLLMFAPLRARIEAGQRPDSVVESVWKRDRLAAARALPRWTSARLAEALSRIARLERSLLLTPAPARAALGEELMQLARTARRSA
jgi:DNA polymerase-3 subunit delta